MNIKQLKNMRKTELVRLIQLCDDENRKILEECDKKQERIIELESSLDELQRQQALMQKDDEKMSYEYQEAGSLAESVIQINGVMEAAQNAARQYLDRIREIEATKQQDADELIGIAQQKAEMIVAKAKSDAEKINTGSTNTLASLQIEINKMMFAAREEFSKQVLSDNSTDYTDVDFNDEADKNESTQAEVQSRLSMNSPPLEILSKEIPDSHDGISEVQEFITREAETHLTEHEINTDKNFDDLSMKQPLELITRDMEEDLSITLGKELKYTINELSNKSNNLSEE